MSIINKHWKNKYNPKRVKIGFYTSSAIAKKTKIWITWKLIGKTCTKVGF